MVESRGTQGVKRKFSDGEGELRCHQRQTVFNISICKLQRSSNFIEPLLCRTVLIANTLKLIEREIEEERKICGELKFSSFGNRPTASRAEFARADLTSTIELNVNPHRPQTGQSKDSSTKLVDFQFDLSTLEEKIAEELEIQTHRRGDCENRQRKLNYTMSSEEFKIDKTRAGLDSTSTHNFERDLLAASNLLGLELNEEVVFSDVDVSLYDFDVGASTVPIDIEELCANLCHNSASRCGESVKFEKASENLLDDLDQVMQILVGS